MKKNLLHGEIVYLSGPMEKAADHGKGWRKKLTEELKKINIISIDPTCKPVSETGDFQEDTRTIKRLREEERWEELAQYVKTFRRADLRYTDLAGCIIAYIDPDIYTCGTFDEIFLAERQHKPRLAIVKGGIQRLPTWLFGVFNHWEVFSSIAECVEYLEKLNSGELPLDDRWVLIRGSLTL